MNEYPSAYYFKGGIGLQNAPEERESCRDTTNPVEFLFGKKKVSVLLGFSWKQALYRCLPSLVKARMERMHCGRRMVWW